MSKPRTTSLNGKGKLLPFSQISFSPKLTHQYDQEKLPNSQFSPFGIREKRTQLQYSGFLGNCFLSTVTQNWWHILIINHTEKEENPLNIKEPTVQTPGVRKVYVLLIESHSSLPRKLSVWRECVHSKGDKALKYLTGLAGEDHPLCAATWREKFQSKILNQRQTSSRSTPRKATTQSHAIL